MKIIESHTKRMVNGKLIEVIPGAQKVRSRLTDKQRLQKYMGEKREALIDKGVSPSVFQKEGRVGSRWV